MNIIQILIDVRMNLDKYGKLGNPTEMKAEYKYHISFLKIHESIKCDAPRKLPS